VVTMGNRVDDLPPLEKKLGRGVGEKGAGVLMPPRGWNGLWVPGEEMKGLCVPGDEMKGRCVPAELPMKGAGVVLKALKAEPVDS